MEQPTLLDEEHHLLIIDDDDFLRDALAEYFAEAGWRVEAAGNGDQGLSLFHSQQPNAVLLDLRMPGIDGIEVMQQIHHESPQTPVIILSGQGSVEDVVAALRAGARDYLTKPVEDLYLLEFTVEEALERARILRENEAYKQQLEQSLGERTKAIHLLTTCFRQMIGNQDEDGVIYSLRRSLLNQGGYIDARIGILMGEDESNVHWFDSRVASHIKLKGETFSVEIRHHNILLGIMEVTKPPGELFGSEEHRLLEQLADVIGFSLHNTRQEYRISLNEASLVESEQRLQLFFDAASEGIAFCEHGSITDLNREFCRQLGYSALELMGEPLDPLFAQSDGSDQPLELCTQDAQSGEVIAMRKDGSRFPAEVRISSLPGTEALSVISIRDLTRSKERDAQLLQARKMEAVGRLTSGLAHDFNNLLTVVLGNLRLLQTDLNDERSEVKDMLSDVLTAAEDATHLTKQLLSFSRKQPPETRTITLNDFLRSVEGFMRSAAGAPVALSMDISATPLIIRVDEKLLQSALLNLVINARDAMPQGGQLTITLREDQGQESDTRPMKKAALLEVKDSGIGMEPEIQEKVFEPFFTTKGEHQGIGIGLSMTYSFVRQMGGELLLHSVKGQGTSVSMRFPLADAQAPEPACHNEDPLPHFVGKALVVEDDPLVRKLAVRMLERLGFEVEEVSNGDQALELLARDQEIDLLFSDIVMPGSLHGDQLSLEVARLYPRVKVVLATGNPSIFSSDRPAPAAPLLTKPYSTVKLVAAINRTTGGRHPAAL